MNQQELKQQINSMQNDKHVEDVFFYTGKKHNLIVVVYRYKDEKKLFGGGYQVVDRRKIQDVLNFFDEEDRVPMGNNVQSQKPKELT